MLASTQYHMRSAVPHYSGLIAIYELNVSEDHNRELQLSNLHVTKACTNALVLLTDKNFLIREI